ncbi:OmpA family protein [Hwanghaeella grinnelliae]|nr:OmpA family protein [Hwanghaeella grinnelliae]
MALSDFTSRLRSGIAASAMFAAGAFLALPATDAAAQWYVEGQGGINIPADSDLDGTGFDVDAEIDPGFVGLVTIGHDYEGLFRVGGEFGYRDGDIDNVGGVSASGDVDVMSAMLNVFLDFDIGEPALKPFIGAGLGVAHVDADGVNPVNGLTMDDSDTGLAGQLIAGLAYRVADNLDVTGTYNLFYVPDVEFGLSNGTDVDSDYLSHSFLIGLRYTFAPPPPAPVEKPAAQPVAAAPPPPPPPPPPPAPEPEPIVRNFIVFFDWDKSEITSEARGILGQAYDYAQKGGVARIVATGHADTSGSQTYNQGLSERRAAAVKNVLATMGFSGSGIVTEAKGETDPLVPTGDGVREPQNRRVEIILQ